jgi:hypothetical protein
MGGVEFSESRAAARWIVHDFLNGERSSGNHELCMFNCKKRESAAGFSILPMNGGSFHSTMTEKGICLNNVNAATNIKMELPFSCCDVSWV